MRARTAIDTDAPAIAAINVLGWRAAYAGLVPADVLDAMDATQRAERMRDWLRRTDRVGDTLVAVDDSDTVLGYTHYGPYRTDRQQDHHPSEGEIYAMYVHPDAWRRGVGAVMMAAALERLAGQRRELVRLWVFADNQPARRFYESRGFAPDGLSVVERIGTGPTAVDLAELRYLRER